MKTAALACTIVAASLLATVPPAHAQSSASGPYYAVPSWDQTFPTSTRFVLLANFNNDAVLDRETGLVWTRVGISYTNDPGNAAYDCEQTTTGGRRGWRLPSITEVHSVISVSSTGYQSAYLYDPYLTPADLPIVIWSHTRVSGGANEVISANYGARGIWYLNALDKSSSTKGYTFCVRSPSPGNPTLF